MNDYNKGLLLLANHNLRQENRKLQRENKRLQARLRRLRRLNPNLIERENPDPESAEGIQ